MIACDYYDHGKTYGSNIGELYEEDLENDRIQGILRERERE